MLTQKEIAEIYEDKMSKIDKDTSGESHLQADSLLCDLLEYLGYENLVNIYNSIGKWYE